MATLYYKYRDTSNIIRILDILIRNRLYACTCEKLNDPMEGKFLYSGASKEYKKRIKEKLDKMMVCSLSTSYNNGLLWTHYANQHSGCCIEVEIMVKSWEMKSMQYNSNLPGIDESTFPKDEDAINAILFQKSKDWEYEKEVRFVKEKGINIKPYLCVKVKKVFLGIRMDKSEKSLIKDFVKELNKGKKETDKITIHQMTQKEINFGYDK